jgi:hypothetical protein
MIISNYPTIQLSNYPIIQPRKFMTEIKIFLPKQHNQKIPYYVIDREYDRMITTIVEKNICPFEFKNRRHLDKDLAYLHLCKRLETELWTFEEAFRMSTTYRFNFKYDHHYLDRDQLFIDMKRKWLKHVANYNSSYNIMYTDRTIGWVGLVFIFVVFPYNMLNTIKNYFTMFETNQLNVLHYYHTDIDLPFVGIEELSNYESLDSYVYEMWLKEKYDQAVIWMTILVYERLNNMKPLIDSEPAKLI